MVEVKIKNKDCWAVEEGYLELGKWYKARYYNGDLLVISPEDNHTGNSVYIFDHFVDVREVLKLEVGKKYVTNGGKVVGPMVKSDVSFTNEYGNKSKYMDEQHWHYSENGRFIYANEDDNENIVSEYKEPEIIGKRSDNPVEEVTVKRLKAGTYGRLKLSTDGYHAINISVVDGGRTWSKDDIEQAIETLTKIKDAR